MGAGNERAKAGGGRKYRDERKRKSTGENREKGLQLRSTDPGGFPQESSITCSKEWEATSKRKNISCRQSPQNY